jgi:GNAT superfamily N-acetyltransferase
MNFRRFIPSDAEFCFKVRNDAFTQKFYGELSPEEVAAGVKAYMPNDYVRMAEVTPFFIVEKEGSSLGFFSLKQLNLYTAELSLLYIDLHSHGRGIGYACIDFIEKWITTNWKKANKLIVDTVIPKYNSGFYKKLGFVPERKVSYYLSGFELKALRLVKEL